MCGDFEEQDRVDEQLFDRFLELAARYGVAPNPAGTPPKLTDERSRSAYMEGLFKAGLVRSVNDAAGLPEGERMDALAGQAIVFARMAGFLSAQLPPDFDLFRAVICALTDGHREAVRAPVH